MPASVPAQRLILDTSELRPASTVDGSGIPYDNPRVTLLLIQNGKIEQAKSRTDKRIVIKRAQADGGILLAAWPGQYSQDIFVVDDLTAAAAGML